MNAPFKNLNQPEEFMSVYIAYLHYSLGEFEYHGTAKQIYM